MPSLSLFTCGGQEERNCAKFARDRSCQVRCFVVYILFVASLLSFNLIDTVIEIITQPTDIVFKVSKPERLEYAFCTVNITWRNGVLSSAHLQLTLQNKLAVILISFCAKREREK